MEIREVPSGERAPDDSDRVIINVLPSGKAGFSGVYQAGNVEAHTISQNNFDTEDEAFCAALERAEARRIKLLYVERPDVSKSEPSR